MSPYRPKGSRRWWCTLTTKDGRYVRLPTETRDRDMANLMQSMIVQLQATGKREWDLVAYLDTHRKDLPRVFDHWKDGTLEQLKAELQDVDLAPGLTAWEVQIRRELAPQTVRHYLRQAEVLFPCAERGKRPPKDKPREWKKALRSKVMVPGFIMKTLDAVAGSDTNRARHFAAWSNLMQFLLARGHLEKNPMAELTQPASNKPQSIEEAELFIEELADVKRLIDAMPAGAHRALAALREGAGFEISAGLRVRPRDVESVADRIVFAHGSKNRYRSRQAIVQEWAWTHFYEYVRGGAFHPDARVFASITEREHRDVHNEACEVLRGKGVRIPEGYTLHKSRRTYTVRRLRAGDDPRLIAENLGHKDERMILTLYGKYRPKVKDLVRGEGRGRNTA